ncbi:MAG: FUN14 domain-containing protein [Planctomycetaceae bacterium]
MAQEAPTPMRWRRRLIVALLLVVAGTVALRVHFGNPAPAPPPAAVPPGGSAILPQTTPPAAPGETGEEPPDSVRVVLPYLTEGGIAMLIGIALGIATRAVFKIAMVFVAAAFVIVQVLAYKGILTMDWGRLADGLRSFVLNVSSSESGLGAVVKHKLPSAASLTLGWYLGLKRR